jgi:CelD/BcsL family acetyltransferase involved in cellulose biosynthesis
LTSSSAVTPFQAIDWLGPWFETLGRTKSVEPVLITVEETATGRAAMALPLVLRRSRGLAVVEFADLSVSDYSFPLLGPVAPETPAAAAAAWQAVLSCLPKADLVRFRKLPPVVDGRVNPLALLPARKSSCIRSVMSLPGTWEDYLGARSKSFRKGLRQKARNMASSGAIECRLVEDLAEADNVLSTLEAFQRQRIAEIGKDYVLDQPSYSQFYREIVRRGLSSGFAVLSVLQQGPTLIATAFGMRHGASYTMVRLANIGGDWCRFSPSLILVGETIRRLIEAGVSTFDFGLGDSPYKRHFGCEMVPLLTYEQPLSIKGRIAAAASEGRELLRGSALCTG